MGILEEKSALRRRLGAQVQTMDARQRAEASQRACAHLIGSSLFETAVGIMVFWPLSDEADPRDLAAAALNRSKKVALPDVQGDALVPIQLQDLAEPMETDAMGVQVPQTKRPLALEALDLVVVPGVGFDRNGGRLGRGGGFYDRFLAGLDGSVPCIGFGFSQQLVAAIPMEPHDVSLDGVVTDLGLQVIDRSAQNQDSA